MCPILTPGPPPEPVNARLTVYLTPSEWRTLRAKATDSGLSMSSIARSYIKAGLKGGR